MAWEPATGRGTVASWIVNHHSFVPRVPSPYVVVLVRLDEQDDILMPGGWDGPGDGTGLTIGLPVEVGYDDVAVDGDTGPSQEAVALLRWRPA